MTQALNRLRGSSSGFYVPEPQIVVNPFPIPDAWPRGFGMAITPAGVAALWGARDEGGTIYLYAEHRFSHSEPSQNARAIREKGEWIPDVINFSACQAPSKTKSRLDDYIATMV